MGWETIDTLGRSMNYHDFDHTEMAGILAWSRRSWQRATIRTDSGEVQTLMRISHAPA
jgi:hypothetical protein